jgi:hypothetical protein
MKQPILSVIVVASFEEEQIDLAKFKFMTHSGLVTINKRITKYSSGFTTNDLNVKKKIYYSNLYI